MTKITDNSDELTFHQLTSQSAILSIPLFQRPYVWSKKQLERMTDEIESIAEKLDTSRFLGAVIAVTRPSNPSQPTPYEIVDGQQRLTTLYLFLLAAAQLAAREGKSDYARGLIGTNLIVDWAQNIVTNTKLQPSMGDRPQFKAIFDLVANAGDLSDWLPIKAKLPLGVGSSDGALVRQFKNIQKYLRNKLSAGGFQAVEDLVDAARNGLTFVFILLKDPGSAFTVFEGLNDPGVPIAVEDLVKNEVFSRIGYDELAAKSLHDNRWLPFRERFRDKFNDYFFPYTVLLKSSTSRTEMFGELRSNWKNLDATQIIEQLEEYAGPYLAIIGVEKAELLYKSSVAEQISKLVRLRQPAATFPFEMKLLKSLEEGNISAIDVAGCLKVLESFLVRRAISGIEPTGLLGLFRTMWSSTDGHPNAENVAAVILKRLTVEWPSDQRVREAIASRPIYGSAIAKYIVMEYDRSLGQDHPEDLDGTLEHIMPSSYCDTWKDVVSKSDHAKVKDLLANLIPLSVKMNQAVAQSSFEQKKQALAKESKYISARAFFEKYDCWGVAEIEHRSEELAQWATTRWKRPVT